MEVSELDGFKVRVARTFFERAKGLIGAKSLPPGEGLLIPGCNAVHTFFMAFPIDLRFYDRNNRLVKTVLGVRPWRLFVWGGFKAAKVLETAAAGRVEGAE
jgi:uncharacterized membrane protein (UPF0127 family)